MLHLQVTPGIPPARHPLVRVRVRKVKFFYLVPKEKADPNDPMVIRAAVPTKMVLRPMISASDPAVNCPKIAPKSAADATVPCN